MKRNIPWLGAFAILVIIFGTIYAVTQQAQRADGNMPQIQMAEDTAAKLNQGAKPSSLLDGNVDMGSSLSPFIIIYNSSGNVVAGDGYLNGQIPVAPIGTLTSSIGQDYHAVTWQPQSNVRIAAVTVTTSNYYVLSGRNIKQIEKNENRTFDLSFLGGSLSTIVLLVAYVASNVKVTSITNKRRKKRR